MKRPRKPASLSSSIHHRLNMRDLAVNVMSYKKILGAASTALMIVIVLTLVVVPTAGAAGKYKVLHAFHGKDGAFPDAGLILDAAGNLYGTTQYGGNLSRCHIGCGVVFKLSPNADGSWTESVLHSFSSRGDGDGPSASLIFDAAGNLYGTTLGGGADGRGTVFKLTPNADGSWTEAVLHSFNRSGDGKTPDAGLILDAAGNLYGTTSQGGALSQCNGYGCGTVFKLTPNTDGSWTETVLHSFNRSDGQFPSGLIFDAAGNLYSTTSQGGANDLGTVFKLTPNADGSWTETVLHSFNQTDGQFPSASLIFDAAGNLYSTTYYGGAHGLGTIFKLTPNADGSWTETVLYSFNQTDGANPTASLIFDAAGNLYSTTSSGGSCGGEDCGLVFKLTADSNGSWTYSLIHLFLGKPALVPLQGSLVLGSTGSLYGTTFECGSGCKGVVYQVTP